MSASCCTREIATTIMAESHPGARPLTTTAVSGSRGMRCHASCECCSGYCNIFHILLFSPSNPRAVSETYWANHAPSLAITLRGKPTTQLGPARASRTWKRAGAGFLRRQTLQHQQMRASRQRASLHNVHSTGRAVPRTYQIGACWPFLRADGCSTLSGLDVYIVVDFHPFWFLLWFPTHTVSARNEKPPERNRSRHKALLRNMHTHGRGGHRRLRDGARWRRGTRSTGTSVCDEMTTLMRRVMELLK